jgi:hypothetical protein
MSLIRQTRLSHRHVFACRYDGGHFWRGNISDFAIQLTAEIFGEADALLCATLDESDPLAMLTAKR